MANNTKNPTALFFARMQKASKNNPGTLVSLMTNFFRANYGDLTIPKTAADFILYDQLRAVGSTQLNFFNGAFATTRSNFPGQFILPQSEHAIIMGLRIMDGTNATVDATGWQPGVADAAAKNAQINIAINGQIVVTSLPLTGFDTNLLSATHAGETDENRGFFFLYEPLVLLGQQQITASVVFPTASATANYNLRVELHGVRFIGN
jgi:hypothetical protein